MNTLSGFKYCIPLTNSKRVNRKYFYYFQISFSLVSERLRYCNFVHRHYFTSAYYTQIPIWGRPFQSWGEAWHPFFFGGGGVNVRTLIMLKMNDMSFAGKEIKNLISALLHLMLWGKGKTIHKKKKKKSGSPRSQHLTYKLSTAHFAGMEF